MPLLLLLALLASPASAGAQAAAGPDQTSAASAVVSPADALPGISLTEIRVAPELTGSVPGSDALRDGVTSLFNRSYGHLVTLTAGLTESVSARVQIVAAKDAADTAPSGAETAPSGADAAQGAVEAETILGSGAAVRSLRSTVPRGSPGALISTIASDLAYLWFSRNGFSSLSLSSPPALTAELRTDTLLELTKWNPEDLEPLGIAASGAEVTLCFPHRYLTVGPRFQVTLDTLRDINAQTTGGEPEQLSAAIPDGEGRILLLSQRDSRITAVDPMLGTRSSWAAPRLAGLAGVLQGGDRIVMPGLGEGTGGLWVYPLRPDAPAAQPQRVDSIGSTYLSALARDGEGNLWAWDSSERRIRVVDSRGRQIYCIRPLFSASVMELPQQLAVFPDGSFLLGGSGEVWAFQNTGIPEWRLVRIPGRLPERLPSSFVLATDWISRSFTLLDGPSHRLLQFSTGAGQASPLAALLAHLDRRSPAQISQAVGLARSEGDTLMALQLAGDLARRGGPDLSDAISTDLLGEKVKRYADLSDFLVSQLRYDRAEPALLRAGDSARELIARQPDDEAAARLLDALVARRREVRDALTSDSRLRVSAAEAALQSGGIGLRLTMENSGTDTVTQARVHLDLPGMEPVLGQLDSVAGGQKAQLQLFVAGPLSTQALRAAGGSTGMPVALLVTYVVGQEGTSAASRLTIPFSREEEPSVAPPDRRAAELADSVLGRIDPSDPLLLDYLPPGSIASAVKADSTPEAQDALAWLASILAAFARVTVAPAGGGPGVGSGPDAGATVEGLRSSLRGLSRDPTGWAVLVLSAGSALGLPMGLVTWDREAVPLVETDLSLSSAIEAAPGLGAYREVLTALSRDQMLCLPISSRQAPAGVDAPSWEVVDALKEFQRLSLPKGQIRWLEAAGAATQAAARVPVAFPLPLPPVPAPPSRATLLANILRTLEQEP